MTTTTTTSGGTSGGDGDATDITKAAININKEWSDGASSHSGESVSVKIYKDGSLYKTVTLSASNSWKYSESNLDEGNYTVEEVTPSGYTSTTSLSSETLTSKGMIPATTLEDGETYIFTYQNGDTDYALAASGSGSTLTSVTAADMSSIPSNAQWTATATSGGYKLSTIVNGTTLYMYWSDSYYYSKTSGDTMNYDSTTKSLYYASSSSNYYVGQGTDVSVRYASTTVPSDAIAYDLYKLQSNATYTQTTYNYTITNTKSSSSSGSESGGGTSSSSTTTNVNVEKQWTDSATVDHSGDSVTVYLYKDGTQYKSMTLNAANNWKGSWTGLDNDANYTVEEATVSGYNRKISGNVSGGTTTYSTEQVTSMEDGGTYALMYTDSSTGQSYLVTSPGTSGSVLTRTAYTEGNTLSNTAVLWKAQKKYDGEFYLQNVSDGLYMYRGNTTFVTASTADDEESLYLMNYYNSSSISLLYTYTTNESTGITTSYAIGNSNSLSSYSTNTKSGSIRLSSDGLNITLLKVTSTTTTGSTYDYTITNSPQSSQSVDTTDNGAPTETVKSDNSSATVTKTWSDGNSNHSGDSVTVNLIKDGAQYSSVTLSASNNWKYTWTGLPKGSYSVQEEAVEGYSDTYYWEENEQAGSGLTKATSLVDGKQYVFVYTGTDGKQYALAAQGNGDYITSVSADNIGTSAIWTATKTSGGFYLYTTVDSTTLYMGFYNSAAYSESADYMQQNPTYYVACYDSSNNVLYSPDESINYYLGTKTDSTISPYAITKSSTVQSNTLTYTLYQVSSGTSNYTYTYTCDITNTKDTYTVLPGEGGDGEGGDESGGGDTGDETDTTVVDDTVTVNVTKEWDDLLKHEKQNVTIHLLDANGNKLDSTYGTLTLNEENNWTASWTGLPKGEYSVEEDAVDGYTAKNTYTLTENRSIWVKASKLQAGKTYAIVYNNSNAIAAPYEAGNVTYYESVGNSTYDESLGNYYYASIPDSSQWKAVAANNGFYLKNTSYDSVKYLAIGYNKDNTSLIVGTAASSTSDSFEILKYDAANKYLYHQTSDGSRYYLNGYGNVYTTSSDHTSENTASTPSQYTLYEKVVLPNVYDYTVTNVPKNENNTTVNVSKVWSTTSHPSSVKVHLTDANGNRLDDTYAPITLSSSNSWKGSWTGLPKGIYKVEEDNVSGYTGTITGGLDDTNGTWYKVDKFLDGGTYALVYTKNSTRYLATADGIGEALGDTALSASVTKDTNGNTYFQADIASNAQWTAESANSSGGAYLRNDSDTSQAQYIYNAGTSGSAFITLGSAEAVGVMTYNSEDSGLYNYYNGTYYFMGYQSAGGLYSNNTQWKPSSVYAFEIYELIADEPTYNYTITNDPAIVSGDSSVNVTVTKKWDSGTTKQPVTVYLYDENDVRQDVQVLSASNNWTYTWSNLPDEVYTVEEVTADGLVSTIDGSRSTSKTIYIPVDSIESGQIYAIGYRPSGYSSSYYLLTQSGSSGSKIASTTKSLTSTSTTVGGVTYSSYLTGVSDAALWTFLDRGTTTTDYNQKTNAAYQVSNVSNRYTVAISYFSGTIYAIADSSNLNSISWNGTYLYATSGSTAYYFSTSSSGTTASSSSTPSGTYKLFKKITETDYNYTITNSLETDSNRKVTSTENYSKRIDSLGDVDNPDTDLDNSDLDMTDFYRLYLDVGQMTSDQGVDLLLVIDESGSMDQDAYYEMGQAPRDEILTEILNGTSSGYNSEGLVSEFLSLNANNKIAAISFNGNVSYSGSYSYSVDTDTMSSWISSPKAITVNADYGTGTNYAAALKAATAMLNSSSVKNDGNRKIMLFLSDGVPTFYLSSDASTRYGNGAATEDNALLCREPSLQAVDKFKSDNPDVTVYTLGFMEETKATERGTELSANPAVLQYMASVGGGDFYCASSGDAIKEELEQFVLGSSKYSVVSMSDQLSDHVELYTQQPDFKLTIKETDSSTPVDLWDSSRNGPTTAGQGILENVYYDEQTRTVKAVFNPNYKLDVSAVYELSFNIQTSKEAYELASENLMNGLDQYTDAANPSGVGDENTDYTETGNDTSSNHPGFRSNKVATFDYLKNGVYGSKEYDHPVVQTSTADLTIKKVSQETGDALTGVTFDLYKKADANDTGTTYTNSTVSQLPSGNYVKVNKSSIVTDTKGLASITSLMPGEYFLVETKTANGYALPSSAFRVTLSHNSVTTDASMKGDSLATGSDTATTLTVANARPYALPNTGGIGTKWYTLSGALLILCSLIIYKLLIKRRKEANTSGAET
jgi:LPXTG-motif cell wall-anchored protein